ncbi:DUF6843 domain-containing protein [Leeuwenhoekiella sp. LLG6367-2.1]|uniref:DUF6843 domain-containing protein n=1 Tax=Leeuwenhoekiella sp. LLG6367-2.1 TaxID=3160833 RepID=UPI003869DDF1
MKIIKHLSILLSLVLFINCSKTKNTVTLIPEGYTGTIRILFDQKNGNDKKYEGEKRIYEIPEKGILKTKFSPQFGYHFPEYYYVSKNGKRTKIERISDLNKSILDTIDKNKVYAYRFMFGGEAVRVDSLGNVTEKKESEIIFTVGKPRE